MAQGSRAVPKNASEAIVVNARSVAVTGLEITSAKGEKVGTLKKGDRARQAAGVQVPPAQWLRLHIAASFADDAEFEPTEQDLCVDKTIRFTD